MLFYENNFLYENVAVCGGTAPKTVTELENFKLSYL